MFGTRQVSFIGQSIPFLTGSSPNGTVKTVNIDFFFAPPSGSPAIVQTKTMTDNGENGAVLFRASTISPSARPTAIGCATRWRTIPR
ncbi:MAG: hypothetical protein HPM95_00520 [Alphaproteobacteria bacterium]|nr:hypothetical protein [Alphaproteobacteria bacterium]